MKIMSFVFVCAVCEACSSVGYQLVAQQVRIPAQSSGASGCDEQCYHYISLHVNTLLCVVDDNHDIIS
jgi:hypothetical protein